MERGSTSKVYCCLLNIYKWTTEIEQSMYWNLPPCPPPGKWKRKLLLEEIQSKSLHLALIKKPAAKTTHNYLNSVSSSSAGDTNTPAPEYIRFRFPSNSDSNTSHTNLNTPSSSDDTTHNNSSESEAIYFNSSSANKSSTDIYLNSSIELYTSKTSKASYEELKQQFHNEKYFTIYYETRYTGEHGKMQIPIDAFFQLDSSKFVLKERLSAGCFGEVYSCIYDGQELVCKITKQIDYHEILINELKEKKLTNTRDFVRYLKRNNFKQEKISEEDFHKYINLSDDTKANFITPYSGHRSHMGIFPKYYGFFFDASANRCIMLFERMKMTLEQYIRTIKTDEELIFIMEEIFNLWGGLSTVLHFDIKPDNIMLDYKNKLKLVDLGLVSFRALFLLDGVYQFFYLPRKNIFYPLTYNETDTNDDFAFAIMILNILLFLNKEKALAAIGDEVVNRSNVEGKLEKLGIFVRTKNSEEELKQRGIDTSKLPWNSIPQRQFKKTILSLL